MSFNGEKRSTQINMRSALISAPKTTGNEKSSPLAAKIEKSGPITPPEDAHKKLKRRRIATEEPNKPYARQGLQSLTLVQARESGIRPHEVVMTQRGSPWSRYRKVYELKLDGFDTIAVQEDLPCDLVIVKTFTWPKASEQVDMLQRIQHPNFIGLIDHFIFEKLSYVFLEYVDTSLAHVVTSPAYPTELHLAAILGQVISLQVFQLFCTQ